MLPHLIQALARAHIAELYKSAHTRADRSTQRGAGVSAVNTTPESPVRELDRRMSDGIEVTLLWNRHTGRVSIAVEDARRDESFEFEVDPSQALAAFVHPYAHAA